MKGVKELIGRGLFSVGALFAIALLVGSWFEPLSTMNQQRQFWFVVSEIKSIGTMIVGLGMVYLARKE